MPSPLLHGASFVSAIFLELLSFDVSTFQVFLDAAKKKKWWRPLEKKIRQRFLGTVGPSTRMVWIGCLYLFRAKLTFIADTQF